MTDGTAAGDQTNRYDELVTRFQRLSEEYEDLIRQMGDEIKAFPDAGVDGFLSHFVISLEILRGELAGTSLTFTMPPAVQTVARSTPFAYEPGSGQRVSIPLPADCTLTDTIGEDDFLERPEDYFQAGRQTVWMQILNLDARMDHETLGRVRIILGETLKREHPDIFQPSFGAAQALSRRGGFPAALFFNPYALIETELGSFRAIHGTLAYGRITNFPPVGTPVTIRESVPLEGLEDVRHFGEMRTVAGGIEPFGRLVALSHPIDVPMQIPGDEAFRFVERGIAAGAAS